MGGSKQNNCLKVGDSNTKKSDSHWAVKTNFRHTHLVRVIFLEI
jgi:hypothetical protein